MSDKSYKIIDHTADIGIIVHGRSLEEIFERAAYAMFDIITHLERVEPVGKYRVNVCSPTIEDLLVDYLSELLYVFTTEFFVMCDFNVKIKKNGDEYSLEGIALGEPFDARKHGVKIEIKAVTYHELEINLEKGYAKVIFDI